MQKWFRWWAQQWLFVNSVNMRMLSLLSFRMRQTGFYLVTLTGRNKVWRLLEIGLIRSWKFLFWAFNFNIGVSIQLHDAWSKKWIEIDLKSWASSNNPVLTSSPKNVIGGNNAIQFNIFNLLDASGKKFNIWYNVLHRYLAIRKFHMRCLLSILTYSQLT